MFITELHATEFKGRHSIKHKLGRINVIIGRNARGKTAILQLVRVLLFGFDPILGSRKLGKLLSGPRSSAGLLFDAGSAIVRKWKRTASGGATEENPPTNIIQVPQVLLDFKTFLEKTGPQQMAYIVAQTDLAALGYTRDAIVAEIKNIRPETATEETEAALRSILAEVEKVDKETAENFNINVWLERVVSALKEKLKIENAEVRRLTNAIQAQVSQQEQDSMAIVAPRAKVVIEREIEKLREELGRLESENAVRAEQLRTYNQKRQQCEQLRAVLAGPDNSTRIAELSSLLNGLEVRRNQPMKSPALVKSLNEASDIKGQASYKLQQKAADAIRIEGELADLEFKECCPACGYAGDEFRAFVRTKLEAKLAEANRIKAEAALAESKAVTEFNRIRENYETERKLDDEIQAAQSEWNRFLKEIRTLADKQAERTQAESQLAAIQLGEPPDEAATNAANERIAAIKNEGKKAKAELNLAIAESAAQLTREQTKQDKIKAEAKAEMTKLAVAAISAKQVEAVEDAMKTLLQTASRFCDGIIDGSLAWNEELGVWRGGEWVSHETFSDMEQALAYVGLSIALSQSSPFKVVLMDRLECVDDQNIDSFMGKIMSLIEDGTIHQFIAVDVNFKRWTQTNPDLNIVEV